MKTTMRPITQRGRRQQAWLWERQGQQPQIILQVASQWHRATEPTNSMRDTVKTAHAAARIAAWADSTANANYVERRRLAGLYGPPALRRQGRFVINWARMKTQAPPAALAIPHKRQEWRTPARWRPG